MTEATAIILIGVAFMMLAFLTLAYVFNNRVFMLFSGILSLIWSIMMYTNTTFFDPVNYIWIVLGVGLFIAFLLLGQTLNKTKKEEIEESGLPDDLREAQLENDQVQKQFQSIRINRHKVKRNRYNGLANE